jgi:hypothetical protein
MAITYDKYLEPTTPPPPCPACGQKYQPSPWGGWFMAHRDDCSRDKITPLPGTGEWVTTPDDDHPWQWRLHPEDAWQLLTPAQVTAKSAEEDAIIEAYRKAEATRRAQN